jgi:hypothetical protein
MRFFILLYTFVANHKSEEGRIGQSQVVAQVDIAGRSDTTDDAALIGRFYFGCHFHFLKKKEKRTRAR